MQEIHYIAVSMEMTSDGPKFHMITNKDHDDFKAEYDEMPGEIFINRTKAVHIMGDVVVKSVDNTKVLKGVADAIAEIKKHRGSYISYKEAEEVFKHLRIIREEAEK